MLLAGLLAGCASLPPRPVPPAEPQPQLPAWYPESPWNKAGANDRALFHGKVVFHTARATIRPESAAVLRQLLVWLQANPDISRVRLEGHTDSRAGEEYNQGLSERRAIAVADWLVDAGLDHNRILAVAFGEARPLVPNNTSLGRQENRRTSFDPAEIAGRRYEDKDPTNGGLVLTVLSKAEREALKNKGKVPTYTPPPLKLERDVFKPIAPKPKVKGALFKKILGSDEKVIDAETGEVSEDTGGE